MGNRVIEATVGKGGVVLVEGGVFEEGSRVELRQVEEEPKMSQEEWREFLDRRFGALADTDFEAPEDAPPSEVEPLR